MSSQCTLQPPLDLLAAECPPRLCLGAIWEIFWPTCRQSSPCRISMRVLSEARGHFIYSGQSAKGKRRLPWIWAIYLIHILRFPGISQVFCSPYWQISSWLLRLMSRKPSSRSRPPPPWAPLASNYSEFEGSPNCAFENGHGLLGYLSKIHRDTIATQTSTPACNYQPRHHISNWSIAKSQNGLEGVKYDLDIHNGQLPISKSLQLLWGKRASPPGEGAKTGAWSWSWARPGASSPDQSVFPLEYFHLHLLEIFWHSWGHCRCYYAQCCQPSHCFHNSLRRARVLASSLSASGSPSRTLQESFGWSVDDLEKHRLWPILWLWAPWGRALWSWFRTSKWFGQPVLCAATDE